MSDPLTIWLEKKLYLEQQLAITSDPSQKFALREQIKECEQEIARLQNQPSKSTLKNNIPKRNRFFTDREKTLKQLSELFTSNKAIAIEQAISGLGGIGKTQTAIEFCYKHLKDYQTILWVKAEHETDINNSYLEIAKLLGLIPKTNAAFESLKIEDIIYLVKGWLINNSNWLMVLDNLEDPSLVKQYLPNNHNGHILITTRSNALKGYAEIVNLKKMSIDTGTLFLLKRANLIPITSTDKTNEKGEPLDELLSNISEKDKLVAQEIVKELDGLPLALEQAGVYIYETQCSLSDYLAAYKDVRYTIPILDNDGEDANDHKSVFTTFKLAFDKVKETSSIAADLLQVCSMLSPDSIPEEIFTQSGDLLGDGLTKLKDNSFEFNKVIKILLNYSLVERDTNNKSISIHRLVQAVIRELMDDSTKKIWFENLVNALEHLRPDDVKDPKNWPKYQRLLPSASALFDIGNTYVFLVSKAATLFHQFGRYCGTQALYLEALHFYQRSLAIKKHHFGHSSPSIAATLNNIGEVYRNQAKYQEALDFYQQALTIYKNHFGDNHPDIATILNNIAIVYFSQCKYQNALDLYQQALAIRKPHFGLNHPEVATIINNVAVIYKNQNKYFEALDFYQQALTIYKNHFGDNHPNVASSLNNIAVVYNKQCKFSDALDFYNQALSIQKELFGDNHLEIALTLNNIGEVYRNQNKFSDALDFYNQALSIRKYHFDLNHPEVGRTLEYLAHLYADTAREPEAIQLYLQALAIYDQFLPSNHLWITNLLKIYSKLLLKLNRNDEAQPLLARLELLNLSD